MSRRFGNCKSNLIAEQIAIAVLGPSSLLAALPQGLFTQNRVALIRDFDKTLIPGHMQQPIFERYNIDESRFWEETNALADHYTERGYSVSGEILYLNHLLTYVRNGKLTGLNNCILKELGTEIKFYEGLPEFFQELREETHSEPEYARHKIEVEHYIVSTGLAEMIRGSKIAPFVEGIWGCEFIEDPLLPSFLNQDALPVETEVEISQIGMMVDNTTKTRALFEINKGSNKDHGIDVNAKMAHEDRGIPFRNISTSQTAPAICQVLR